MPWHSDAIFPAFGVGVGLFDNNIVADESRLESTEYRYAQRFCQSTVFHETPHSIYLLLLLVLLLLNSAVNSINQLDYHQLLPSCAIMVHTSRELCGGG